MHITKHTNTNDQIQAKEVELTEICQKLDKEAKKTEIISQLLKGDFI